jgi:glycyl-tRNA synthetase beta chain
VTHILFEIGFEEFPPSFIVPALEQLKQSFISGMEKERISPGSVESYSTSSRIALIFKDVPSRQPDLKEKVTGAPKKIALGEDGKLTKAGESFLAKNCLKEYFFEDSPKGEIIAGWKEEKGKDLSEVVVPLLNNSLNSLNFKKSMRWGTNSFYFARPIRWILLNIDGTPVEGNFETLQFGKNSYGHRFLHPGEVEVAPLSYADDLKKASVIVDRNERVEIITRFIKKVIQENNCEDEIDAAIMNEVADMVEYPYPVIGNIPDKYRDLPPELIIKVLKKDQRYFTLREKETGKLFPRFISVLNNVPTDDTVVLKGNEKVVSGRLADAAFYYGDDLKKDFAALNKKLKEMLFQKDLGTYYDKVERIAEISQFIAEKYFNAGKEVVEKIRKTAMMIKNDLVTGVVFEFPDLQGVMGRYYAQAAGFDDDISCVMEQHYMPLNAGEKLPENLIGKIISMADKADTIAGGFMAGMKPTGSKDKFAIRRNGLGLLSIAASCDQNLVNVKEVLDFAASLTSKFNSSLKYDSKEVNDFISARYQAVLGAQTTVVQAAAGAGSEIPVLVRKRVETIERLLEEHDINDMAQLYKRGCNILKKQAIPDGDPDPLLFEQEEEKNLYRSVTTVCQEIVNLSDNLDIALKIITIKSVLDLFFDSVFVMADDESLKNNRLKLIRKVTDLVREQIGDISYLNI